MYTLKKYYDISLRHAQKKKKTSINRHSSSGYCNGFTSGSLCILTISGVQRPLVGL